MQMTDDILIAWLRETNQVMERSKRKRIQLYDFNILYQARHAYHICLILKWQRETISILYYAVHVWF